MGRWTRRGGSGRAEVEVVTPELDPDGAWWTLLPFTTHRIELAPGVWSMEGGVDAAADVRTEVVLAACGGSLAGRSVVDLGSNEGGFTLAFGQLGAARSVGIEARPLNVRRADLARVLMRLDDVEFVEGDVKTELATRGPFDVVFASGILYHIGDPFELLHTIRQACTGVALIDTHIATLEATTHDCSEIVERRFGGQTFTGRMYTEYPSGTSERDKRPLLWAAWSDHDAFWPIEDDLVRMLGEAGFASVEKLDPLAGGDPSRWGVDPRNRVLYLARV